MSDEQKHNDSLERLFRKKAEEYDISYKEEDWLNLEKQLDARDMKLYYRRRLRWLAVASILILSLIGYYTLQNHNKINELTEQLNQNQTVQKNEEPINSQENLALAENESSEPIIQVEEEQENTAEIDIVEGEESKESPEQETVANSDSESVAVVVENESTQFENLSMNHFAEADQVIHRKLLETGQFFSDRPTLLASAGPSIQPIEITDEDPNRRYQPENVERGRGQSTMLNSSTAPRDRYSANSRLAVGVVVSPDLSTAGSVTNFYDPGFKGGLLAEYSLSKNISLISGITISNLKYRADGRAYDPPQYWNSGVMPDETTAVCVVLDIPLNLKANLFHFDRSRIFATAGLSSYIMLNEDYRFRYNQDEPGLQTSWNEATGTRHWFSNAGLSIGFEYDLSSTWSLRAEPHIKIPLKGVGWGDVELYSLGSFVSLNYRFGRL